MMKTLLMAVCGIFIVSAFGANELSFVGDGKSGSLTNELNYESKVREHVTNPVPENRWRIGTGEGGGTYSVTLPDDYSLLGCLWVYAWKNSHITIDGRGADFRQWAREDGGAVNSVDARSFTFLNNAYGNYQVELNRSGVNNASFRFVNSYQEIVRDMASGLFRWNLMQGEFSFAESATTLVLGNSQSPGDRLFEMNLNNVTSYFPSTEFRCLNTNNCITVSGGELQLKGAFQFDRYLLSQNKESGSSGTNEFVLCDGAVCRQTSGGMYIGSASAVTNSERVVRMSVDGSGTEFSSGGEILISGRSKISVSDGGRFTTINYVRVGNASDAIRDCPAICVSGEGSLFDASRSRVVRFNRDASLEVCGGAKAILPPDTKFGEYVGSNSVFVSGIGSELLFTNIVEVSDSGTQTTDPLLILGYGNNSTCIVTVADGGFLGFAQGVLGRLRLGQNSNTYGVLDVDGGRVVIPTNTLDDATYVGYSSSAEINVSGGELIVSNAVRFSAVNNPNTPFKSVVRQSGGDILFYNGINLDYMAQENFTGEMFLLGGTMCTDYISGGSKAYSVVHANGGTILPRQNRVDARYPLLQSVDLFEIGAKGLTIDTDGKNVAVGQYFTNFVDEAGLLVKKGKGALTLSTGRIDVDRLRVENGSFVAGVDNSIYSSAVSVVESAIFSTVGACSKLTLSALAVTNATLALDPGDEIIVEGNAGFSGLKLDFSSLPETENATELLRIRIKGELDENSRRELVNAVCVDNAAAARHVRVLVSSGDEKSVTVEYLPDSEPLAADNDAVYVGGGAWNSSDSWSNKAVSGADARAVFGESGNASPEVELPADACVGALKFTSGGYRLFDGALRLMQPKGAAVVEVQGGSHEIASEVECGAELSAVVAEGASLELSGTVVTRGISKTGLGWLRLTGILDYVRQLSFAARSIDFSPLPESSYLDSLVVGNAEEKVPAIVVANTETVVGHLDVNGLFIKRGPARFVLDASKSTRTSNLTTFKPATDKGQPAGDSSLNFGFPDDGSAPEGGYGGFTVAEGEFVIKGEGGSPVVRAKGSCVIGMNSTNTTGNAMLTVDGATLDNYNGTPDATHFILGCGAAHYDRGGHYQVDPTLRLINGAVLKVDTLRTGHGFWGYYETHPTIAMTNSVLWCLYATLTTLESALNSPRWFTKNSRIIAHPATTDLINVHAAIDALFDSTYIGPGDYTTLEPVDNVRIPMGNYNWSPESAKGRVAFVNGSQVRVSDFANYAKIENRFTYVWDDSEWDYGGGDHVFESAKFHADNFKFEMRGRGLILKPNSGSTFTVEFPFTGEGGFVNAGEGTVKFASGAYGFGGICEVVSGTVDLTDAGALSAVKVKGGGTVKGLTARSVRIMAVADDDWKVAGIPGFDSLSANRVTVDFGRSGASLSNDLPKGIVLGKLFGGAVGGISGWRVANTGYSKVSGRFSIDDAGVVSVDLERTGMAIIVR